MPLKTKKLKPNRGESWAERKAEKEKGEKKERNGENKRIKNEEIYM